MRNPLSYTNSSFSTNYNIFSNKFIKYWKHLEK
jgi:hypothetical protein